MLVSHLIGGCQSSTAESPVDVELNCTATEAIRDAVYVASDNTVNQATNTDIDKARAVGFILSKSSDTTCKVRVSGILSGFTGLEAGKPYFLDDVNGGITKDPVTTTGRLKVRVGQAVNSTDLNININNNILLRG